MSPNTFSARIHLVLMLCLAGAQAGFWQIAIAAQPIVQLPNGPLSKNTTKPNVMLDLSVEFPTVGTAYPRQNYQPANEYYGYFNAGQCYKYTSPSTYTGGKYDTSADLSKYFSAKYAATADHKCKGDAFSGNFMNWVASSSIDMLRLALTGGNRVVDDIGKTVLERAVLPGFFYADPYQFAVRKVDANSGFAPKDVTPFAKPVIYALSCRNRILFTTNEPVAPGPTVPQDHGYVRCDQDNVLNPEKNLGEFLVRVEACSDAEGPQRPALCQSYGGGHYKPVGELQKNADKARFAAMSYILDSATRYGGVLRAPMKFVGPTQYDKDLNPSPNPAAEWDASTGIFIKDPLSPSPNNRSGVINYLNMFGDGGNYKVVDNLSEMYYESLRYLRGLQPSPDATAGMTPAMMDGFPVITDWLDPIQAACQKNSIILIADANTDYDFSVPGNTTTLLLEDTTTVADGPRAAESENLAQPLDVRDWANRIGVMENTTHGPDSTTRPALANLADKKNGYTSPGGDVKGSYYVSALAYWGNTTQMRKDKQDIHVQTYVLDVDEGGNGTTDDSSPRAFTRPRDSQLYLAAKYGGYKPDFKSAAPGDPFKPMPTTFNAKTGCYYYDWDKDGDCNPDNYYLANDGVKFVKSIQKMFRTPAVQGEAVNLVSASGVMVSDDAAQYIYQSSFDTVNWTGDLRRSRVVFDAAKGLSVEAPDASTPTLFMREPSWPATGADAGVKPRKIYTYNGASNPLNSTIAFDWAALSSDQRATLNGSDQLGEARLHYLRGATNNEYSDTNPNGQFRARPITAKPGVSWLLGDIINSSPLYVGVPATNIQDRGYSDFYNANKNRAKAVYVGANDGMLHAFDPTLQTEYFAYVPQMIFEHLNELTEKTYRHRAYVDGRITVAEAKLNKGGAGGTWATILAASMGSGAQGVFALNVTNPANFDAKQGALWEFSDADDPDMGNVYNAPNIAKFLKSVSASGVPTYEHFVVVASGVNNYATDPAPGPGAPKAKGKQGQPATAPGGALFLLSVNKAPNSQWKEGENYFKFPIPNSSVITSLQSGLSAAALVTGPDGAVRMAYAGDLQGNLWRFAFPLNVPLSKVTAHRLFTASRSTANPDARQPITSAPKVVFAPAGGYVVMFGTGKYMEDADLASRDQQSFYGIYDSTQAGYSVSRSELEPRVLDGKGSDTALTIAGKEFTYTGKSTSTGGPQTSSDKKGWYLDFANSADSGERSVTPGFVSFGKIFFNSMLLPIDACQPISGGRSYAIDSLTGLPEAGSGANTAVLSNVGILSTPTIFETRVAAVPAQFKINATGKKIVQRTYAVASFGSSGIAKPVDKKVSLPAGRLSWREIFNYKELKNSK